MIKACLEELPNRVRSIPAIANNTLEIIHMVASGEYEIDDLTRLIETDMTLAGRCLQMVNSPLYGLKAPVANIKRAIILLGPKVVADVAIQTGLSKNLGKKLEGYESAKGDLWKHGLRVAIGSRKVAGLIGLDDPEIAYASGLLHDIGKVIVSEFLLKNWDSIRDKIEADPPISFHENEEAWFGANHAQVGALIADQWNLPEAFKMVIKHHHNPAEAPEPFRTLVAAVHMGDIFAMMAGAGTGLDTMSYSIDPIVDTYVKRDVSWELEVFPKLLLDIDTEYRAALALSSHGAEHV